MKNSINDSIVQHAQAASQTVNAAIDPWSADNASGGHVAAAQPVADAAASSDPWGAASSLRMNGQTLSQPG